MTDQKDNEPIFLGGDALIDALLANGLDTGFGVPGESYLAVLDAINRSNGAFNFVTCRHEASASNMAEAAGKLTGKPGLCFVTRGPGATHATTGLHTAFQDSTPMILLIGQVASDQRDREAFQELDYRKFLSEVTKWTAEIDDPARISEYIGRAVRTAMSGRPGPVALALPEDMLSGTAPSQPSRKANIQQPHPDPARVQDVAQRLKSAKKPFLLVGGSGWDRDAVDELKYFSETHNIPTSASFRCQDRLDNDSPAYVGDMGIAANPKLVEQMQSSDLLIVLGSRLGEMTTNGYSRLAPPCPAQTIVHVHQGAEELGRVYQCEQEINSAPGPFLSALKQCDISGHTDWANWCKTGRDNYIEWQQPTPNPGAVQVANIHTQLRDLLPKDAILTNGAGNYAAWLHRFARYHTYPSQLAPTSGAMGYGLPAAIAAKILSPKRPVICFAGDGCLMMSINELATAVQNRVGIIILLFNNSLYGTIRMHQATHYPGRISGTQLSNPDFALLAESFGAFGVTVETNEEFTSAWEKASQASAQGKPALINIIVDPDAISPTKTLSELERL